MRYSQLGGCYVQLRIQLSVVTFLALLLVAACSQNVDENGEYPYGHYKDDEMIGTVERTDEAADIMTVDISEWEKRDRKGPDITDEGYSYTANINQTVIKYEDGTEAVIDDIKKGQKVLVNPPRGNNFEGHPEEIIVLEMTNEEKYSRLLSHIDGYNIVVMYEMDDPLPAEMEEELYERAVNILQDKGRDAVGAWIPYDENFVIDYKEEFSIEQFPAILVFDEAEMVFKTYDPDKLYDYLKNK